jgi:hypothetical protein
MYVSGRFSISSVRHMLYLSDNPLLCLKGNILYRGVTHHELQIREIHPDC